MVKIEYFYTDRLYRYLWLKYVKGYNLSVHCAKCLKGYYDPNFGGGVRSIHNLTLRDDAKIFYLCGVSNDRIWKHNLHIAFIESPGDTIIVDDEFCSLRIVNAKRLEINPNYIEKEDPNSKKKEFYTCRNWQFAYMLSKGVLLPYNKPKIEKDDLKQLNLPLD